MSSHSPRRDVRQDITNAVIARIEAGDVLPWKCPWVKSNEKPMPHNFLTKVSYSGINILLLWAASLERNFSSNAWLTFNQANNAGGRVRKRSEVGPGVTCYFFQRLEIDDKNAEDGKKLIPYLKPFTLFNIDQLSGLSEPEIADTGMSVGSDAMLQVADRYCANTGVTLSWGGDRACYSPGFDHIRMPKTFKRPDAMAHTLAHELIHSTGHKNRLDRFSENDVEMSDAKSSYAFEELVAEMGAEFTCAELSIHSERESTVSYIDNWLGAFRHDKTFLFKAVTAASKAQQYLLAGGRIQHSSTVHSNVV